MRTENVIYGDNLRSRQHVQSQPTHWRPVVILY